MPCFSASAGLSHQSNGSAKLGIFAPLLSLPVKYILHGMPTCSSVFVHDKPRIAEAASSVNSSRTIIPANAWLSTELIDSTFAVISTSPVISLYA